MEERGWQPPSDMSTWHSDRIFGLVLLMMMVVMVLLEMMVVMVLLMMIMVVEDVEQVVGSLEAYPLLLKKRSTANMK